VSHGAGEIRGIRENSLSNASLRIPTRPITIVTGVSGSGTSSIVFATIAAEARRLDDWSTQERVNGDDCAHTGLHA
jgi:excinuclease UvrABC ATPase subunit